MYMQEVGTVKNRKKKRKNEEKKADKLDVGSGDEANFLKSQSLVKIGIF